MTQSLLALMDVLYVDHVAVTTPLFDQTLADYLGLPGSRLLRGPALNPVQKVSYAFVALRGGLTVEVLGLTEGSPIERHVRHGGGPYHFCYAVGSMEASIARAESAGAALLGKPMADVAFDGRRVAFLFHEAQGIFELVEALQVPDADPAMASTNGGMERTFSSPGRSMPPADASAAGADERLVRVFSGIFPALEEGDIHATTINTTAGWDSLTHMRLMMAIEDAFGTSILPEDIGRLTSYRSILAKLKEDLR
jgi:acyl carrier protein/catechol 2,3-dioxygenase-like lactoylglutathione lyase family enzyme